MSQESKEAIEKLVHSSLSMLAPGVIGCALGMVTGARIRRKPRRRTAFGLLALGVAAAAPALVSIYNSAARSPRFNATGKKRLEGIRSADSTFIESEEELQNVN